MEFESCGEMSTRLAAELPSLDAAVVLPIDRTIGRHACGTMVAIEVGKCGFKWL